ncbi:MAG TPA: hypothetical protein PLH21_06715 [Chiayiivirga sp.]|nr:hypothetical protein [Chiayiivirga sp.]
MGLFVLSPRPPSTYKKPALAAGFLLGGNITGALLVQSATGQAGRPIILVVPADLARVTRAAVNTLHAWAALPLSAEGGRFEPEGLDRTVPGKALALQG